MIHRSGRQRWGDGCVSTLPAAMALRIDVFTIFPGLVDASAREPPRPGPRRRPASTCAATTCATTPPTSTARSTTPPSAAAPAWCCGPSRSSPAVEAAAPAPAALLLGPGGRRFDQALARELAGGDGFSLLCGRYEGVDHRVRQHLVDGELSIGDYVLAGGEVAACVVIEAVTRLLPGVMGNESVGGGGVVRRATACWRSPSTPGRPSSGAGRCPRCSARATTARIARWRHAQALHRTLRERPDLLEARGGLTDEEGVLLGDRPLWRLDFPVPP